MIDFFNIYLFEKYPVFRMRLDLAECEILRAFIGLYFDD